MKLKYKSISILFATLMSCPTLASVNQAEIIKGTDVGAQDWIAHSVVALISSNEQSQALCTASIVAQDLAITAAHCVTSDAPDLQSTLTLIFSRDIHGASPANFRKIDRVEVPAEWNPMGSGQKDTSDVAVVHFSGGLPAGYAPSNLLPFNQPLSQGQAVVLAGYGITNATADTGAGVLRKTTVVISDPNYSISEVELDQTHGGGACHGDSGGPAYVIINGHPYLFGITSRGGGNCDEDVIYTKISAYQDWFARAVAAIRK